MTIVDLSQYNTVKSNGTLADGVILRLGFTGYGSNKPTLDKSFWANYKRYNGHVPIGVYYVTLALTDEDVRKETEWVIEQLKGCALDLPVWVDVESQNHSLKWTTASKKTRSNAVAKWCKALEKAGYYVGVYANKDWLINKLDWKVLEPFDKWVAQYSTKCTYPKPYGMWQYTSKGNGLYYGVNGYVDISVAYKNYPAIIKKNKLNGWGVTR